MRLRVLAFGLAVLVSTCSKKIDAQAAQDLSLHYDVYYLALPVLTVDVDSRVEPTTYRTTVSLQSAGLLGFFAPWMSRVTARGAIDGATVRPIAYRADSEYRDRSQKIDLDYERAGRVRGAVVGVLTDGERDDVPIALRDGTLDPVRASAALARRLAATGSCAGTVPIFDGLRRYDLRYEDLGTAVLAPSRRDPYRGLARHCRATIDPIAGFLRTGERAGERATELSAWLAPPFEGARPVVVRIDLAGTHGTLHAHLARATPAGPISP
jgi:hypothetical protein